MSCDHHPPCITHCVHCGTPLPEFAPVQDGVDKFTFLVAHENGSKHVIVGCVDAEEAGKRSNTMLARSAGLCLDHLVRISYIKKMDTADALWHLRM